MWIQFEPDSRTLISALKSKVADTSESVIACWFRLSFRAKIELTKCSVAIFDDAGYFFQKWVLALTVDSQTKPVFFLGGGWIDFDGQSVTLGDRDQKAVLQGDQVTECVGALVKELQEQLKVMEIASPNDAAEIAFTSETYLLPLQNFLKGRQR